MILNHDVVVVGGGLAGLMAALTASRSADVAIVSKLYVTRSHSGAAQGGFNAAMGDDDTVEAHVFDTVKGSDYLGDQDAIEVLCQEGPEVILELEAMGVPWSRTEKGRVAQRSLGGAAFPRSCYAADFSGHVVLHTLYEQAIKRGIRIYPEFHLVDLLMEEGRSAGIVAYDLPRAEFVNIRAKAVLFATGGSGRVFAKTSNALANTGDGMAVAYRAGAILSDMEFVQFHPTTLYGTNILISEAARGEGGYLRNVNGERFMVDTAPGKMELAPRDVVSRAIFREIVEGRGVEGRYVHLDLTHLGGALIEERLPQVRDLSITYADVDPVKSPMPIEPAQHYSMGGVRTDTWGATAVPGLLAAGETANLSVHGANRLGGNSLLEAVVFGRRAGMRLAELAKEEKLLPPLCAATVEEAAERWQGFMNGEGGEETAKEVIRIRRESAALMTENVGIYRTGEKVKEAVEKLKTSRAAYAALPVGFKRVPYNYTFLDYLEAGYLLELSELIAAGALAREECRGAHHRLDFPERDDTNFLHHTFATRGPDGALFTKGEVCITRYQPQVRSY